MGKNHEVIVCTISKDIEERLKCHSRHKNMVSIREEKVTDRTLINEDPKQQYGVYKSSLIDLEAYGVSYGDRAQAEQYALAA